MFVTDDGREAGRHSWFVYIYRDRDRDRDRDRLHLKQSAPSLMTWRLAVLVASLSAYIYTLRA